MLRNTVEESDPVVLKGTVIQLPKGLWRVKRYPCFSNISEECGLPWGSLEVVEDSALHHDLIKEAGVQIISQISKGSFSTVWKGSWKKYNLPVAVKIYDKRSAGQALRTLANEIHVLKAVKHPYCVSCFGVWETELRVYLALELLDENLLVYLLRNGPVDESKAKLWFAQGVSALKHLHELMIAHRDIKCENFLLDTKMNVRLGDFGFCTMNMLWDPSIPNSNWTKFSDYCGSHEYFPPEVILQIPYCPLLGDVWSLGVVLYAILFGRLPFNTRKLNGNEMPNSWKIPSSRSISPECYSVFKRIFTFEDQRIRSYELSESLWFGYDESQKHIKILSDFAGKTLKEKAETEEKPSTLRLRPTNSEIWKISRSK